ncbi:MAG: ribokinase [Bacillota bacterium]|nr:ribokinase [Bacillota bacterium]
MRPILVVGSLNMDLVFTVERAPRAGETVTGLEFSLAPGGKGANQTVAAGRLGGTVSMVGRVGDDPYGENLLESLRASRVDTSRIGRLEGVSTGLAAVVVEKGGENRIIVVPGANGRLSPEDLREEDFPAGGILLLQLEIPLPTVKEALRLAKGKGMTTILDPAPAPGPDDLEDLGEDVFSLVDMVTPNREEARALTGIEVKDLPSALEAARRLLDLGVGYGVVKLGAEGVLGIDGEGTFRHIPGLPVAAVDTTAAGDAFAGGLAVALAEGKGFFEALSWGNRAGALSTTRPGAQPSLPWRQEWEMFGG